MMDSVCAPRAKNGDLNVKMIGFGKRLSMLWFCLAVLGPLGNADEDYHSNQSTDMPSQDGKLLAVL